MPALASLSQADLDALAAQQAAQDPAATAPVPAPYDPAQNPNAVYTSQPAALAPVPPPYDPAQDTQGMQAQPTPLAPEQGQSYVSTPVYDPANPYGNTMAIGGVESNIQTAAPSMDYSPPPPPPLPYGPPASQGLTTQTQTQSPYATTDPGTSPSMAGPLYSVRQQQSSPQGHNNMLETLFPKDLADYLLTNPNPNYDPNNDYNPATVRRIPPAGSTYTPHPVNRNFKHSFYNDSGLASFIYDENVYPQPIAELLNRNYRPEILQPMERARQARVLRGLFGSQQPRTPIVPTHEGDPVSPGYLVHRGEPVPERQRKPRSS